MVLVTKVKSQNNRRMATDNVTEPFVEFFCHPADTPWSRVTWGHMPSNDNLKLVSTKVHSHLFNPFPNKPWPRDYKSLFMLNSAEHEISMLDKSRLINLLEELLIYRKFHCFYISNQTFEFDFSYTHKHQ